MQNNYSQMFCWWVVPRLRLAPILVAISKTFKRRPYWQRVVACGPDLTVVETERVGAKWASKQQNQVGGVRISSVMPVTERFKSTCTLANRQYPSNKLVRIHLIPSQFFCWQLKRDRWARCRCFSGSQPAAPAVTILLPFHSMCYLFLLLPILPFALSRSPFRS